MNPAYLVSAASIVWSALCLGLFSETILPSIGETIQRALWFWTPSRGMAAGLVSILPTHAASIGTVLLLNLAALGAGRHFLSWTGVRSRTTLVMVTAGLVMVLPAGILGLGLAGLFRTPIFVGGALLMAGFSIKHFRMPKIAETPVIPLAIGAVMLVPSLLCALVPEVQYDALQYHLALPRRFLEAGRIYLSDPWPHTNFHLAIEALFAPAMAMGGDAGAKLLNWQFFPLMLLLVRKISATAGLKGALAHLPWLILASSPLLSDVAGQTFTDEGAACAITAAVLLRMGPRSCASSFAIGALVGAAGAVKAPSAVYGLCALPFIAPRGRFFPALAGWLLPVVAWPAKSFLLTGSPFGGMAFTSLWPTFMQNEVVIDFLKSGNWTTPGHHSLWLTFPLLMLRGAVLTGFEYSPFIIILLPLLAIARPAGAPFMRRAVLASFVLWPLTGGGQVRFLVPFIPLALLACITPLAGDSRISRRGLAVVSAVISIIGLVRTSAMLFLLATPLNTALGIEERRSYLARIITPVPIYMAAASFIGENPEMGRPYLAGDIKSYYWPRDPRNDNEFVNPLLFRWARDSRNAGEIAVKFRQSRIGCIAHQLGGAVTMASLADGYKWTGRSLEVLQRFWAGHMSPEGALERPDQGGWFYFWKFHRRGGVKFEPNRSHWMQIPYTEYLLLRGDMALNQGRLSEAESGYQELKRRLPRFALIPLRLAEIARLRGNMEAMKRHEREAMRLMGAS